MLRTLFCNGAAHIGMSGQQDLYASILLKLIMSDTSRTRGEQEQDLDVGTRRVMVFDRPCGWSSLI